MRRNLVGSPGAPKYAESHVKSILRAIGVQIVTETEHDFLCFCPIHGNKNTPSLSVSKTKDSYLCFNGACGASGSLIDLVTKTTDRNIFEAMRFVLGHQPTDEEDFEDTLNTVLLNAPEFDEFPMGVIDRLYGGMCEPDSPGRTYMHGRGFTDETIDFFKVGYSSKKKMVAVPMHSPDGLPIGIIGRSTTSKKFKNSAGLATSKTWFNLHRAKRASSTAIVVEASFDALAVHQAGFPNVVAALGSGLSEYKMQLLDKHFDKLVILTDNRDYDTAGASMGMKLADRFITTKDILWGQYSYVETYARNVKDATDMTSDEIVTTIVNAIPHFELMSMV